MAGPVFNRHIDADKKMFDAEAGEAISLAEPRKNPFIVSLAKLTEPTRRHRYFMSVLVIYDRVAESGLPVIDYMRRRLRNLPVKITDAGEIICEYGHITCVVHYEDSVRYFWSSEDK